MKISVTKDRENKKATIFEAVEIKDLDHLLRIAKDHGYSPSIFKDNYRNGENVISTECLFCDIDNTKESPCSIQEFHERWKGYKYVILTSRNHQKEKQKKPSEAEKYGPHPWPKADRFHVLFPLGYVEKSFDKVKKALVSMTSKFDYFDKAVSDPCRQFFGAVNTEIFYNDGRNIRLDEFVEDEPIQEVMDLIDCPEYLKIAGHEVPYVKEYDQSTALPDKRVEMISTLQKARDLGVFDDYPEWMRLGAGLKSEGYSFDEWLNLSHSSQRSGAQLMEAKKSWASFNGKVTGGTLTEYCRRVDPDFMTTRGAKKKIQESQEQQRVTNKPQSQQDPDTKEPPQAEKKEVVKRQDVNAMMPITKWDVDHCNIKHTEKGMKIIPKQTIVNYELMLNYYHIFVKENLMTHKIEITIGDEGITEGKHENAIDGTIEHLLALNEFPLSQTRKDSFAATIAHRNAYHPVRYYFDSLEWDGVDRLGVVADLLPTKKSYPDEMKKIIIKKWFTSAVACIYEKSYRGRGVLVLQGPQSYGKTNWFKSFMPKKKWFQEGLILDPKNKDSVELAVSAWVCELGELEGLFKRDIAPLKAFLTKETDSIRFAYERRSEDYPRRTVFCGSVNQGQFLNDSTGASRFWTIPIIDYLPTSFDQVDQFWAQAKKWYMDGEIWYLTPEEELKLDSINSDHSEVDHYSQLLDTYYDMEATKTRVMNATEVLKECGNDRPSKFDVNSMTTVLKKRCDPGRKKTGSKGHGFYMPEKLLSDNFDPDLPHDAPF